jgi:hypothetical protein
MCETVQMLLDLSNGAEIGTANSTCGENVRFIYNVDRSSRLKETI